MVQKVEDVKIGDKLKGNGDNINTVKEYQPKKTKGRISGINDSEFSVQKTTHFGQQRLEICK